MSDPNEVADTIEAYETTSAIEVQLESELILVNEALSRIEKGDYGRCTICGGPIEEVRLLAYPAARTCKTHMNN
jgi:RNA polymerase-binding transcription factor DksA